MKEKKRQKKAKRVKTFTLEQQEELLAKALFAQMKWDLEMRYLDVRLRLMRLR